VVNDAGLEVFFGRSRILLEITFTRSNRQDHDRKTLNYNLTTILAVIAILFVLLTYITGAPLVPVAVILLGLAIIFGGNTVRRV
jgi:Na+/H+ antiporter NhaC